MSLAFAMFGAPRYPTEEAPGDSWGQLAQYNADHSAYDYQDRHEYQWANTRMWRVKRAPTYPDDPPYKRRRDDVTPPSLKTAVPLVPVQPAGPPPAHILEAVMYENSILALTPDPSGAEDPTLADKILRWIGWAIRFGFHSLGIEVSNGWAHLHVLAKAATSARMDFAGLTPGALRNIIELDVSGRWWLAGGRVCKVPRSSRWVTQDYRPYPSDSTPPPVESNEKSSFY